MNKRTGNVEISRKLRRWRQTEGIGMDDLVFRVRQSAPHALPISREMVRRYETGAWDRSRINHAYLAAACSALGHSAAELGPDIQEEMTELSRLFSTPDNDGVKAKSGNRCKGVSPGQNKDSWPEAA